MDPYYNKQEGGLPQVVARSGARGQGLYFLSFPLPL